MKLPLFRPLSCLIALSCFLSSPGSAAASQIVNWGGNYTSTYAPFEGTPVTSDGSSTWLYSSTIKKSPNYSGPALYGAFSLVNGNGEGTPTFRTDLFGINPGALNQIRFSASPPTESSIQMRGLIFVKKEDFLSGAGGKVTFDETSHFKLKMSTSIGDTRQTKVAVYALYGGEWGWYLSGASGGGASKPFEIPDLGAAQFGLYSIDESSAPLSDLPSSYAISGSSFDEIGAVGVFFNYEHSSSLNTSLYIESFSFDAQAIPEPSVALLSIGGAMLAIGVRSAFKKEKL